MKFLVVGAGFAGAASARVLADAGHDVLVIDARDHIGGNAFDYVDDHGVLVHKYGPHIFHTNSKKVFDFLSRFTAWTPYEHRVLSSVNDQLFPIPINRTTLSLLLGRELTEGEVTAHFEAKRVPFEHPRNSEEVVLNSVGTELCELFFSGYTRKQWGLELKDLSAGVAARIPTRTNDDDRYFTDTYQFMPREGYTAMFRAMLDHPNIEVQLGVDYFELKSGLKADHTIYTGPIDKYFGCRYGALPYRSLRFEHTHHADCNAWQPVGTVNYPNDHAYTRITEMKKLTGQHCTGTSLVTEYPTSEGDPYYPIPRQENQELFHRYAELAERETQVSFVGRLAEYRYYNMDQVVASALHLTAALIQSREGEIA
jgi:UDP-galactopyranose mutase